MDLTASFQRLGLMRLPQAPLFLVAAFALLIIIILSSLSLLEQNQSQRDRIVEAVETQAKLDRIVAALRRMESAQRGYLISGSQSSIALYNETSPVLARNIADVERALPQSTTRSKIWSDLQNAIKSKVAEMDESIRLYNAGDVQAAYAVVRNESGIRYMEEARALVDLLRKGERSRLDEKYAEARLQERIILGVNMAAVLLIIAAGVASSAIVRRANVTMANAQTALKNLNTELEASVSARTAELRVANEEIQKFAYIVSHDLRSPLVNIMGFTSELETLKQTLVARLAALQAPPVNDNPSEPALLSKEDQVIADDFDEALSFIKASIVKMDRLIKAVLMISREGNRVLKPEDIDMNALLDSLSQSIAHQTQKAGAEIKVDPVPMLTSDRLAVEQIFSNLLDNAVKYLSDGRPGLIRVTGRAEGNRLVFEVEDNGRGIEAKDQERVFELFRRAGAQDKPGEGMGLAHVRALVRRLGGVISIKSTSGEGSTFTVTLPRTLGHASKRMSA